MQAVPLLTLQNTSSHLMVTEGFSYGQWRNSKNQLLHSAMLSWSVCCRRWKQNISSLARKTKQAYSGHRGNTTLRRASELLNHSCFPSSVWWKIKQRANQFPYLLGMVEMTDPLQCSSGVDSLRLVALFFFCPRKPEFSIRPSVSAVDYSDQQGFEDPGESYFDFTLFCGWPYFLL